MKCVLFSPLIINIIQGHVQKLPFYSSSNMRKSQTWYKQDYHVRAWETSKKVPGYYVFVKNIFLVLYQDTTDNVVDWT